MNEDFVFEGETYIIVDKVPENVQQLCRYSTGSVDNYFIGKKMIFWKSAGWKFYTTTNL